MQQAIRGFFRRSVTIKLAVIAIVVFVLLIPIGMVEDVILDRSEQERVAQQDITRSWGGPQFVAGPILVLPYAVEAGGDYMTGQSDRGRVYVLPAELGIRASMDHKTLHRGIYEVPVFSSDMTLSGRFDVTSLDDTGIPRDAIDWTGAYLVLAMNGLHSIRTAPVLADGAQTIPFTRAEDGVGGLPQLVAPLDTLADGMARNGALRFDVRLALRGSHRLRFAPIGDVTRVVMTSSWPSPKFVGEYLPESREINVQGFVAEWEVPGIGRALPGRWLDRSIDPGRVKSVTLGAELYTPVSLYRLALRASGYAVLFITLTFAAWFLFEQIASLGLHPLQYLLVGFANALFFLLLLSLAEHTGFAVAYLVSASASAATIAAYSAAVLGERRRALTMLAVLATLYAYLYMTLRAESYAMLFGAVLLWAALAGVMYLTRHVDWYRLHRETPAAPES